MFPSGDDWKSNFNYHCHALWNKIAQFILTCSIIQNNLVRVKSFKISNLIETFYFILRIVFKLFPDWNFLFPNNFLSYSNQKPKTSDVFTIQWFLKQESYIFHGAHIFNKGFIEWKWQVAFNYIVSVDALDFTARTSKTFVSILLHPPLRYHLQVQILINEDIKLNRITARDHLWLHPIKVGSVKGSILLDKLRDLRTLHWFLRGNHICHIVIYDA